MLTKIDQTWSPYMFWSDLNLREGLKAKKRVTGLVLAVILSFVGELVHFVAMWSRCGWRCWQRQYQWQWWDENHEFEKRWTSNTLGPRGDGNKILYLFVDILIPVHNVQFVKYNVTVSFMAQVLDTVTYLVPQVIDTASSSNCLVCFYRLAI